MQQVSTTVSSTHCCARPVDGPSRRRGGLWAVLCCLWAVLALLLVAAAPPARAESQADIVDMQLEHTADGLFLTAAMQLELPTLVEDALYKGISMYFIAEAEVLRQRWYWSDKTVARATRYLRLSYQPLTRRWRLSQSATPFLATGLGVTLGQNFEELSEALAVMQRIARWKIAEEGALDDGASYLVNFQFRIDRSQLPRPLQIGAVARSGWSLQLSRSMRPPPRDPAAAEARSNNGGEGTQ